MNSSTPEIILRPNERASIKIPWRGSPSANYDWLKEVCGSRTRPKYDSETKRFLVARTHVQHVVDALVLEYGQVKLVQYGNVSTTCVEACWNAKLDSAIGCECGCAGVNHGSGSALGYEVQEGLSVEHEHVRAEYIVTVAGRKLLGV